MEKFQAPIVSNTYKRIRSMINRLFVNIYGNVGSNIQDTSSGTQTVIKNYVNDIYFDILKRINWQDIDDDYSFSTVAGTQDYVLPSNFGKEVYVYDATNLTELKPITMQELVRDFPSGLSLSGTVSRYAILNKAVRSQPSSSSTISVVSSSASDSTQTVRIKGYDSNGVQLEESITLNGTSAQTSSNSYVEIQSITKSASTVGRITVTSNSGAVTVAILAPADLSYMVKVVRLNYTPNGAITVKMPYIILPYPLVSDYDQPVIDAADVIELGATMKAWRYKRQFQKAMEYERQYETAINTLIWDKENSFNQAHYTSPLAYPRNDV